VRFGIIAPDEGAIARQLVGARAEALRAQLDRIEGKIELGLKAFWYEEVIFAEIVAESAEIRRLRDSLAGRSPEETYYERIRLGELIEGEMARRREADSERILAALRPLAVEAQISPPITDRMVVNAAFLIDGQHEAAFDAAVQALDVELGKRILFKVVGPVPPYNFVSLLIGWD
jgi:Gas vesicle synthesis protein GvpL/GvpF